jgi:hypothetical protein
MLEVVLASYIYVSFCVFLASYNYVSSYVPLLWTLSPD